MKYLTDLLKGSSILGKENQFYSKIFPFILFLFIVFFYNFLISKYQFFLTDGWFETFAIHQNAGFNIYNDYQFFLPPLVVNLFATIINFLGLDFLVLKYIFSLIHVLNFYIIFLLVKKYTDFHSAIIASLITFFLIINNSTFSAKDYHTIVSLLIALTILIIPSKDKNYNFSFINCFLIGLLIGALVLTKHNIGVIFGFSLLIYITFNNIFLREKVFAIFSKSLIFLLGIIFLIFLANFYLSSSWLSIFSFETPKGSIVNILLRFIIEPYNRLIIILSISFVATIYFIYFLIQSNNKYFANLFGKLKIYTKDFFSITGSGYNYTFYLFFICIFVLIIFGLFTSSVSLLFIFALSWPLIRILTNTTLNNFILCIPLYALAYAGTTTAGFNSVSLEILLALFFAEFIFIIGKLINKTNTSSKNILFIFPILLICLSFGTLKLSTPSYNWWGLQTNSILNNINTNRFFEQGIFKNIRMDHFTYNVLNYARQDLNSKNKLFTSPSIPMFHLINNKESEFSLISWYDTYTEETLNNDLNKLKNSPPDTIYLLNIPDSVNKGHYELIKYPLLTTKVISDQIINKFMSGDYIIDHVELNINYEECNHSYVTNYIDACNIGKPSITIYTNINNSKIFNTALNNCSSVGMCNNLKDQYRQIRNKSGNIIEKYTVEIANQYWYKKIIEDGKAIVIDNNLFYGFYKFKKDTNKR